MSKLNYPEMPEAKKHFGLSLWERLLFAFVPVRTYYDPNEEIITSSKYFKGKVYILEQIDCREGSGKRL